MADFVKAARTTEIEPGQARLVEVKGKQIALFNVDSQFFLQLACETCSVRFARLTFPARKFPEPFEVRAL